MGGTRHRLTALTSQRSLLSEVLALHARHLDAPATDLRASASIWSLDYMWLLLPGAIAGVILLRHGLPLEPASCLLDVDAHGTPARLQLPDAGQALLNDSSGQKHLAFLVRQHLAPMFSALHVCSGLPLKILWGNAARVLADIFTAIQDVANINGTEAALLTANTWPDGTINPLWLHGGQPTSLQAITSPSSRHAQCCLRHLIPTQIHCGRCPLDPAAVRAAIGAKRVNMTSTPDRRPPPRHATSGAACGANHPPSPETGSG